MDSVVYLVSALIVLLITLVLRIGSKRLPGPVGLPIVGFLPFVSDAIHQTFNKLSKVYGDVFEVTFYGRQFVVLNSFKAIRQALSQGHAMSDRPVEFNYWSFGMDSVAVTTLNGDLWRTHRKFSHSSLFSMPVIKDNSSRFLEIGHDLVKHIAMTEQRPHNFYSALTSCSANAISLVLFNQTFEWDDPSFLKLKGDISDFFSVLPGLKFVLVGPYFRLFEANPLNWRHRRFVQIVKQCKSTMMDKINERLIKFDDQEAPDNFIDAYLIQRKMELDRKVPEKDQQFRLDILANTLLNMFLEGTDTSAEIVYQGLFLLAKYPVVQRKVQNEIDFFIGKREPSIADKSSMSYTMAVIEEILRFAIIVPLGVTRQTAEDITIGEQKVQKGSLVLTNYFNATRDPEQFKNPDEFDPQNFLNDNGQFTKNEANLAFSLGRRNCIGEAFFRHEIFLFLVMAFQSFSFIPPPDAELTYKVQEGLVRIIEPFQLRALPRQITAN